MIVNVNYSVPQKISTKKPLLWYDTRLHAMRKFSGDRLTFKYQLDPLLLSIEKDRKNCYRLVPSVVQSEEKVVVKKQDKKAILKWFQDYQNYNDSKAEIESNRPNGMSFNVPDDEVDDFLDQLNRSKLLYEVL